MYFITFIKENRSLFCKTEKFVELNPKTRIGCNRHSQTAHGDEGLVQEETHNSWRIPRSGLAAYRLSPVSGDGGLGDHGPRYQQARSGLAEPPQCVRSGECVGKMIQELPSTGCACPGIEIRQEGFSPAMSRGSLLKDGRRGARIRRRAGWSIIADKIK